MTAEATLTLAMNNQLLQTDAYTNKSVANITTMILSNKRVKNINIAVTPRWQRTTPAKSERIHIVLAVPAT